MKRIKKRKLRQSRQSSAEGYRGLAEAHKERLISFWKDFLKSGVFVVTVLIVIILACIAWYVANNRVHGETESVSAKQDIVRIASKGIRQTAEKKALALSEGVEYVYNDETYYYTEGGEIAMHLAEDYSVSPGARGSIEFYIIPTRSGAITINLYMGLAGYKDVINEGEGKKTPERVNDNTLEALMSGHILWFQEYKNGVYSGWLYNKETDGIMNNSITINIPNANEGEPIKQNLYWIWPKRYENMVYDLFDENTQEYKVDFSGFLDKQSKNAQLLSKTEYSYSRIFLAKATTWPLNDSGSKSKAYNLADEYIGKNADYLYLTISTSTPEENMEESEGNSQ